MFYWFTAVIFILLPLVLLAVFNSVLIHIVKQSRATRRTMTNTAAERDSHSQSQENKITIMLIAVVLLALFCQLPVAVMLVYQSLHQVRGEKDKKAALEGSGGHRKVTVFVVVQVLWPLEKWFSD